MDDLEYIKNNCFSFSLEFNDHKTVYETPRQYFENHIENVDSDLIVKMEDNETVVDLQIYTSAISYIKIFHWDLMQALSDGATYLKIRNSDNPEEGESKSLTTALEFLKGANYNIMLVPDDKIKEGRIEFLKL